ISITEFDLALSRIPVIRARLKTVIDGIDSIYSRYTDPYVFKAFDGELSGIITKLTDLSAINVVLPRKLGGSGDLGIAAGLAKIVKEIYPQKTIRLILFESTMAEALKREIINGFELSGPAVQEVEGIAYVNVEKGNKVPAGLISEDDICLVFAAVAEENELFRFRSTADSLVSPAKQIIIIKDPGMEVNTVLSDRLRYPVYMAEPEQALVSENAPQSSVRKQYKYANYLGLLYPDNDFRQKVLSLRSKRSATRNKILAALNLPKAWSLRRWGVVYANSGHAIRAYLDLFNIAYKKDPGMGKNGVVVFMGSGGFKDSEKAVIAKAKEYGYRLVKINSAKGTKVVLNNSKSNVVIVLFDFVNYGIFEDIFIFADDLPSLVRGAVTLSNQYYISSVTGRPFLFESSIWQGDLSYNLEQVAKSILGQQEAFVKFIFGVKIYPQSTSPEQYESAAELFYLPSVRQAFKKFTSISLAEFDFRQNLKVIIEAIWTEHLSSSYSPLFMAVGSLRKKQGMAIPLPVEWEHEKSNRHNIDSREMHRATYRFASEPKVAKNFRKLIRPLAILEDYLVKSGKVSGPPVIAWRSGDRKMRNLENEEIFILLIASGYAPSFIEWFIFLVELHEDYPTEETATNAQADYFRNSPDSEENIRIINAVNRRIEESENRAQAMELIKLAVSISGGTGKPPLLREYLLEFIRNGQMVNWDRLLIAISAGRSLIAEDTVRVVVLLKRAFIHLARAVELENEERNIRYFNRKVPDSFWEEVWGSFGDNMDLTDIKVKGFTLGYPERFRENHYEALKGILERLSHFFGRAPPLWRLVITTNLDYTAGNVAGCNISTKTVYIHIYFFTLTRKEQLEIVYHELIAHILNGQSDEVLAR
ncbi:MAG: hypothetical protein WC442_07250, partial [Candidatus Omnitrophota bacterium]